MKVVVTGAKGFLGKNLGTALRRRGVEVAEVDLETRPDEVLAAVSGATVLFHLAGINRPDHEAEFLTGNVGSLESQLAALDRLRATDRPSVLPKIVLASSTQAEQDNSYGRSKLAAEHALEAYSARTETSAVIYRLPGVFGKWCRPNYNSVVATFCYNIARDLPVAISDPEKIVQLVHVDDVVAQFMAQTEGHEVGVKLDEVRPTFTISLGDLVELIRGCRVTRKSLAVADTTDPFICRLLGTYTSYLPPGDLAYSLDQRTDVRGTLAEMLKSPHFGQLFVSRTKPGFTRGNHYHDRKVEKFCVVEGKAAIRFRSILAAEVTEYIVSGTDFTIVDIPPGMTHSIENVGSTEMIVLFWASEILDTQYPDTHYAEVLCG